MGLSREEAEEEVLVTELECESCGTICEVNDTECGECGEPVHFEWYQQQIEELMEGEDD